jgi:hypothetical protein
MSVRRSQLLQLASVHKIDNERSEQVIRAKYDGDMSREDICNEYLDGAGMRTLRRIEERWNAYCDAYLVLTGRFPTPDDVWGICLDDQEDIDLVEYEQLNRKLDLLRAESKRKSKLLTKRQSSIELLVDEVASACTLLPNSYEALPAPDGGPYDPEVAMLDLSDWHLGAYVRPEDTAGLESHSWNVLTDRVEELTSKVVKITLMERMARPINKLYINFLGDIVDGEDIFAGHGMEVDFPLVDQVFEAIPHIEQMIHTLLSPPALYEEITINGVWGNHGRTGRKGTHHPRDNWDYLLYRILAERFANVPQVKFRISDSSFMLYRVPEAPEFVHLIAHGDHIKSSLSIPYYGIDRATARWISLSGVFIHYVHLGHCHRSANIDLPHGEQIINGALVGPTPFAVNQLNQASTPKQWFYGLHPRQGVTWRYPLMPSRLQQMEADENHVFTPYVGDGRNRNDHVLTDELGYKPGGDGALSHLEV